MSKIVFILGAGASAPGGAPVMSNFLEMAHELAGTPSALPAEARLDFDLLFKARAALQSVHSKSTLDINNIETLLGAFDMAALLGRLGDLSTEEIGRLPLAVRTVIAKTIERRLQFCSTMTEESQYFVDPRRPGIISTPQGQVRIEPPVGYFEFGELIHAALRQHPGAVSVITFNYDLALDYTFTFMSIPFDYCLETAVVEGSLHLLKLHGSLNWGRCAYLYCKKIVPLNLMPFLVDYDWRDYGKDCFRQLEICDHLPSLKHCGRSLEVGSVIVPPTWNKAQYHGELAKVWRRAAGHLSDAEFIFVIGYSCPATDEFFKYLYALGSVGDSFLKALWFVNTDSSGAERFGGMLGPLARRKFVQHTGRFEHSASAIRGALGLDGE